MSTRHDDIERGSVSPPLPECMLYSERANEWYARHDPQFDTHFYDHIIAFPNFHHDQENAQDAAARISILIADFFEAGNPGAIIVGEIFNSPLNRPIAWTPRFIFNMVLGLNAQLATQPEGAQPFGNEYTNFHMYNHIAYSCFMYCSVWHSFAWNIRRPLPINRCLRLCLHYFKHYIQNTFLLDEDRSYLAYETLLNHRREINSGQVPPPNLNFIFGDYETFAEFEQHRNEFNERMSSPGVPLGENIAAPWDGRFLSNVWQSVFQNQRPANLIMSTKCLSMHAYKSWLTFLKLDSPTKRQALHSKYNRGIFEMAKMLGILYAQFVMCGVECICLALQNGHIDIEEVTNHWGGNIGIGIQHSIQSYLERYVYENVKKNALVLVASHDGPSIWYARKEYNKRLDAIMMMLSPRLMRGSAIGGGENLQPDIVQEIVGQHAVGVHHGNVKL